MDSVLEQVLIAIVKKLITQDVIDGAKVSLIAYLRGLAANTSNQLDDSLVNILADALGVK